MSRTRKRAKRWDDYEDEDFNQKRNRIDRREEKKRKNADRLQNLRYDENRDNDSQ